MVKKKRENVVVMKKKVVQAPMNSERAAAFLGTTRVTLWRWRVAGKGPKYRIETAVNGVQRAVYDHADLLEFAREGHGFGGGPVVRDGWRGEQNRNVYYHETPPSLLPPSPEFDD